MLCRTLADVDRGAADLAAALPPVEGEFRTMGYAALRQSLATQRSGLSESRLGAATAGAFFRTAQRVPALRRLTVPFRRQARPRRWERDGRAAHSTGSPLSNPDAAGRSPR